MIIPLLYKTSIRFRSYLRLVVPLAVSPFPERMCKVSLCFWSSHLTLCSFFEEPTPRASVACRWGSLWLRLEGTSLTATLISLPVSPFFNMSVFVEQWLFENKKWSCSTSSHYLRQHSIILPHQFDLQFCSWPLLASHDYHSRVFPIPTF